MEVSKEPTFLVNTDKLSAFILINGKASFLNANTFKTFINDCLERSIRNYIIDFKNCTGMDSTFLGIIAWLGLQINKQKEGSYLIVRNFNKRNKELFYNLGLENFITTEESVIKDNLISKKDIKNYPLSEEAGCCKAIDILNAHKNLIHASKKNNNVFKDLISILENKLNN